MLTRQIVCVQSRIASLTSIFDTIATADPFAIDAGRTRLVALLIAGNDAIATGTSGWYAPGEEPMLEDQRGFVMAPRSIVVLMTKTAPKPAPKKRKKKEKAAEKETEK